MDDAVYVRITVDGACFIDDEFFASPPGASLNEAVLAHLQLEAAALETPVRAVIHDEQSGYTMTIQVNTDGTSQPLDDGGRSPVSPEQPEPTTTVTPTTLQWPETADLIPPDRPYEPLPEPYRGRLEAICETACQNRFSDAARDADQMLTELSTQYGPSHLYTLAAGFVRGDIAWLAQDFHYGLQSWTFMAKAWHELLGPQHSATIRAVGNAIGCWRRLRPADALAVGGRVLRLLEEVAIPGSMPAVQHINRRLYRISVAN